MAEVWSEWIEHDGKGCPVKGQWIQGVLEGCHGGYWDTGETGDRIVVEGVAGEQPANWDWSRFGEYLPNGTVASKILRYRVRQYSALADLKAIAANPQPVGEPA